jgi:predicted nuclease with TOPRIM domain
MKTTTTLKPSAPALDETQETIANMRLENKQWHSEHSQWLKELEQWRHDQNQLEARIYKLEHALAQEDRNFSNLLEAIDDHDLLLCSHDKSIDFAENTSELSATTLNTILNTHQRQRVWQENLRELQVSIRAQHLQVMEDMRKLIRLEREQQS